MQLVHETPSGQDGEGRRLSQEAQIGRCSQELRGAAVGSPSSALGYSKFVPLKRETPCTVIWEKFGFKV